MRVQRKITSKQKFNKALKHILAQAMSSHFNTDRIKSKSVETLNISNHNVKRERSYDRFCDYFNRDNHIQSDSSQDICVVIDDRSDISSIDKEYLDSGVATYDDENVTALDRKINKLNSMLQEQHLLLKALKEDLISSNAVLGNLSAAQRPDLLKDYSDTFEDAIKILPDTVEFDNRTTSPNDIFNLVEKTHMKQIEREIRRSLVEFLQSDDLKEHIASATAESVREVIGASFASTFPSTYLPIIEQSNRRLLRHVTRTLDKAFNELEAGSISLFNSVHKILQAALEKHEALLESNRTENNFENFQSMLQTILKNEMKEWREKLLGVIKMPQIEAELEEEYISQVKEPFSPISPPQPADPERSIIDQLMKSAEINKHIKEGDINKSFEEALSSSDLSLVMAACKAADLDKVFSTPCSLKQSVLLSLVQQLATDMVHDTQLKCRYLEEAIINLNASDHTTRIHLPLVVGEVRKHLSKFLRSYPSHVASRRITLIIMAANNLLK